MNKSFFRKQICQKRMNLPSAQLEVNSQNAFQHILGLRHFQKAKKIGSYIAANGEITTSLLHEHCWKANKALFVPKILPGAQLQFCQYQKNDALIVNKFGIGESSNTNTIKATELDIVFVPLVAFDQYGHRIGMGMGYYDRCFEFIRKKQSAAPILIGLAHSFQELPFIEAFEWDVQLNVIITDSDIKFVKKK